jgi:hypothetical protein
MKYLVILLIGFAAAAAQAKESILISLVNQQFIFIKATRLFFRPLSLPDEIAWQLSQDTT